MKTRKTSPIVLGYLAVALPLVTMHLSFLVSVWQGHIDWCMPYWANCVSISKSGRYGLAYFVFKGGMIPSLVLFGLVWQICSRWLETLGKKKDRSITLLGWLASFALLLYTLALGHAGDDLQLLRRFGVVLFLGLTFIIQVRVGYALKHSSKFAKVGGELLWFSAVILMIAVFSLILDAWLGESYKAIENAFEWWLVVLLIAHLFVLVRLWHDNFLRREAR